MASAATTAAQNMWQEIRGPSASSVKQWGSWLAAWFDKRLESIPGYYKKVVGRRSRHKKWQQAPAENRLAYPERVCIF